MIAEDSVLFSGIGLKQGKIGEAARRREKRVREIIRRERRKSEKYEKQMK